MHATVHLKAVESAYEQLITCLLSLVVEVCRGHDGVGQLDGGPKS
eukprot:SAG11_NODE_1624_length_4555_cov_3.452424_6_plen_45_part_00